MFYSEGEIFSSFLLKCSEVSLKKDAPRNLGASFFDISLI